MFRFKLTHVLTILSVFFLISCGQQGQKFETATEDAAAPQENVPATSKPSELSLPSAGEVDFTLGEAPQGDQVYVVDAAATDAHFTIVSNSAGPVTGRFPEGYQGWLNLADGKGKFAAQIDNLKTFTQDGMGLALRDQNVIEAFFGVRPSSILPEPVDKAWQALSGKLQRNVQLAGFEIESIDGLSGLADGATAQGSLDGNLVFWDTITVSVRFPVEATRSGDTITLSSTEKVTINLVDVMGQSLRDLAFQTMLAAGCAHQPGIQNDVVIGLDKVVLQKAAK
jgi:hypothetical protein